MMRQALSIRVHLAAGLYRGFAACPNRPVIRNGLTDERLRDDLSMFLTSADPRRLTSRAALVAAIALMLLPVAAAAFGPLRGEQTQAVAEHPMVSVDWQGPESLPRHFRNHCRYDRIHGRWYCANHCGPDYQFYFCSPESFGCCHVGYGYCDWKGHLRCAP